MRSRSEGAELELADPVVEIAGLLPALADAIDALAERVERFEHGGSGFPWRLAALGVSPKVVTPQTAELTGLHAQNPNAAEAFLHFFDATDADEVVVGTSVPHVSFWVPGLGSYDLEGGVVVPFKYGIVAAATTTLAGSTGPATGLLVNALHREA